MIEPIAVDFYTLIICAVTDLKMRIDSGFYEVEKPITEVEEEELFSLIQNKISKIEPLASKTSFWEKLIKGY